jgi:hypothetical protein
MLTHITLGLVLDKDDPLAGPTSLPEVISVKTVAMSSSFSGANAPTPPPYFRPANFPTLSALAAISRPDTIPEEADDFRLPSFNPPWLDRDVYKLHESLLDDASDDFVQTDGVDVDVDEETLRELEILRYHLHDNSGVQWKKDQ